MKNETYNERTFLWNLRKCLALFLCISSGLLFSACGSPAEQEDTPVSTEAAGQEDTLGSTEAAEQEPLLDADATDEELLALIEDDIHRVADEDYSRIVAEIKEDITAYSGQLYQFEGVYTEVDGNPYISNVSADGDEEGDRLPLQYLTTELEEGTQIRVTGVVNQGEVDGKEESVLDVITVEFLEGAENTET